MQPSDQTWTITYHECMDGVECRQIAAKNRAESALKEGWLGEF